jgi:glutathione S-transferase
MAPASLSCPLSWSELEALVAGDPARTGSGRSEGPTNAQARLRLFGQPESSVRVTLYRDHHAWCPYCQKVWLWLEERQIPYRVEKVTMFCYGEKEAWYKRLEPSGMLPALALDGRLVTESDRILEELERAFGSLGPGMADPAVLPLRRLERQLFRAWCQWLCVLHSSRGDAQAGEQFRQWATAMEQALAASGGPFLLGAELGTADLVFVPYVERMNASLAYYKGYLLRQEHPGIDRWFQALEHRSTYRGTQSDFHTHCHDLPPQMGGCNANGSDRQLQLAARIDRGPWPILDGGLPDPETSEPPPMEPDQGHPSQGAAARIALARVLRHRQALLQRNPLAAEDFDLPLRTALTNLSHNTVLPPPAGAAAALRHLRDRISVPRDMPLHAARRLRRSLEHTARLDPADPTAMPEPIPIRHRRDQDPAPFLAASSLP